MQEVLTIPSADGSRRVVIFRRPSGTYGFEEQVFSAEALEQCWIPCGRYSACFLPTAEAAVSEASSRVSWLAAARRGADD